MADIFSAFEAIPNLEELWINETTVDNQSRSRSRSSSPLNLKRLRIHAGHLEPCAFMTHVIGCVEEVPLVTLELRHKPPRKVQDYLSWMDLIRMASKTLREVYIHTWEGNGGGDETTDSSTHTALLAALGTCKNLRKLTLAYRLEKDDPENATTGSFLASLCAHLGQQPPPHPLLETLHLRMFDRNQVPVSVTPALCNRLARTLLDKLRYRDFARLKIEIAPEVWEGGWKKQYLLRQRTAIMQEWETLFGAFRRARGVEFQMEFQSVEK